MSRCRTSASVRRTRAAALVSSLAMATASALSAGDDWPQFRGPGGQGHADGDALPLEWSSRKNVAWRAPVPGKGWASPIIHAGRVYLSTAVEGGGASRGDISLRLLALDAASGKGVWDVELFRRGASKAGPVHKKNSHASPTPLADGESIYVHYGANGTAAVGADGKVRWRNEELVYQPVHGCGGSPALVGELLIVSCDGAADPFVAALERRSGAIRWRTPRPRSSGKLFAFSTPLAIEVAGKTQVLSAGANWLVSYEPESGREIWRVGYDGYSVVPRPVFAHGLVFISTGYDSPTLLAVRPDGAGDVTGSHVAWSTSSQVSHNPSFIAAGDELYLVSDGGVATCFDARSGRRHWRERLGGNFSASPVLAGGKLYFLSEEGECTVLAAGKSFRRLARNEIGERTLASPAVAAGAIFIRGAEHLFRIQTPAAGAEKK
jgi:outer membrane protein assembly factor BamB